MPNEQKTKRKFNPSSQAAATKEAATLANSELVSSLSLSEYKHAMSAVQRFLDPESSTNDDACTFSETARTSTFFRPKIVQDVNIGPSGLFRIIANPRFYRPLAMTDFSKQLSRNYQGSRVYATKGGADVSMVLPQGKPSSVPLTFYPTSGSVPLPATELVDTARRSVCLPSWDDNANGGGWIYKFSEPRSFNMTLKLDAWKVSGVPTVSLTYIDASDAYLTTAVAVSATPDQNLGFLYTHPLVACKGISIRIATGTPIQSHSLALAFDASNIDPDEEPLHFFDSSISETVQRSADAFINLGMSVWVQYTGADLVNGGETGGYRYPPDNLAKYTDLRDSYSTVTSTPGALVGKIKQGAWGFYLPQTAAELDFKPLESFEDLGYLIINGKKNSADASIRVNFNQVLLVSTTNQAFSKVTLSSDPAGLMSALTMLRLYPGVIPNDGHQEKIRKIKGLLKSYYPQIKKGVKTIGQVVKTAAPIIAALA